MGKVTWITKAGTLGTIQEGKFFKINLKAQDEDTGDASTLYYTVIAGRMPEGIQCSLNGIVEGSPKIISTVKGVPSEVSKDETSRFIVKKIWKEFVHPNIAKKELDYFSNILGFFSSLEQTLLQI